MTTRSWNRTDILGSGDFGDIPKRTEQYNQYGANATRAERAAGIYKDHNYTMSKLTSVKPQCSGHIWWDTTIVKTSTDWYGAMVVFGDVPPPDLAKAVSKLLEKWRNSTFDAGVSIGEGKESVEMIVQRLRSLANSAQALRKGNFGGALAALAHVNKGDRRHAIKSMNSGYFANAWLELQYGWKPLLNDIYSAAEFVKTKPKVGVIRSSVKESSEICTPVNASVFPQSGITLVKNERRRNLKVTIAQPPSTFERLGLTDPLTIAWELVPYSFVADWFAPIGDTLKAIHANNVMNVISCCDTEVIQKVARMRVVPGTRYGSYTCSAGNTAITDRVDMTRSVSSSLPSNWAIVGNTVARFFLKPLDLSASQLISSAALTRARLGKLGI